MACEHNEQALREHKDRRFRVDPGPVVVDWFGAVRNAVACLRYLVRPHARLTMIIVMSPAMAAPLTSTSLGRALRALCSIPRAARPLRPAAGAAS